MGLSKNEYGKISVAGFYQQSLAMKQSVSLND